MITTARKSPIFWSTAADFTKAGDEKRAFGESFFFSFVIAPIAKPPPASLRFVQLRDRAHVFDDQNPVGNTEKLRHSEEI
jgi:hypothetical protein